MNRAFVVLFDGNEVPKNVVERIANEISTWCRADIERISISTFDEDDISKSLIMTAIPPKIGDDVTAYLSHLKIEEAKSRKYGDAAIRELNSAFHLRKDTAPATFCLDLSLKMLKLLDKDKIKACNDDDLRLINAIRNLGRDVPYTTSVAKAYYYTSEIDEVVKSVYRKHFTESDGTFKK